LIFNGKKLKAYNNFLKIKQGLKFKEFFDPYIIFLVSMMKITPDIVFLSVKLGGSSQGVPMPISEKKRIVFGVK
jgi:ribosomal protein S7